MRDVFRVSYSSSSPPSLRTMLRRENTTPNISFASSDSLVFLDLLTGMKPPVVGVSELTADFWEAVSKVVLLGG